MKTILNFFGNHSTNIVATILLVLKVLVNSVLGFINGIYAIWTKHTLGWVVEAIKVNNKIINWLQNFAAKNKITFETSKWTKDKTSNKK